MTVVNCKAFIGLLQLTLTIALFIFVPAWTVRYWQGWLVLSVLFISFLAITLYLMKNDPFLLARRIHAGPAAEKYRSQKIGQFFGMLAFIAIFVVAGFDHRIAWSSVPTPVALAGDVLVL
jgi:predicted tellurium resistance membrane protein TerC